VVNVRISASATPATGGKQWPMATPLARTQ